MAKVYVDTELIIFAAKQKENEDVFNELLSGHQPFISDIVIAEIHNLNEPFRHWTAQYLEKNTFPVIKISEEAIEFAKKYVYNKVIDSKDLTIGLHFSLASYKGIDFIVTPNEKWEQYFQGFKRINEHFNLSVPEIKKVTLKEIPQTNLEDIREKIARLLETQGTTRLYRAIIESQEHFSREKKIKFQRIEKI